MELVKRLDAFRRTERDLPTCPVKWATLPLRDKVFVDGHHVDAGKDNDSGDNDDDDDDDDGVNMMSSDAFMFSSVSSIFDFESSVDQKLLDKVLLPALLNAKGSRVQEEVGSSRRHKRLCHPWAEADVVGRTALHYLASWGSSRLMHALVQLAQDATATVNVKHKQSRSNQREQLRLATQALLRTVNQRDVESGWTALHRAFYHGRLYVALLLLHTESVDLSVKDHDGRIAFDILREMLPLTTPRGLPYPLVDNTDSASQPHQKNAQLWLMEDIDESSKDSSSGTKSRKFSGTSSTMGQKIVRNLLYTWGSNDNYLLGHAGQNDRARPDRTPLHRHTLHHDGHSTASYNMYSQRDPALFIREVAMSKLHTLVVTEAGLDSTRTQRHSHTRTADGEYGVGNLLTCGFGRGGRLGNSEATRFVLEPVQGIPDPVITAACGRDHTVAVTSRYEVYTFGNGAWGQLGYQVSCNSTNQRSGAAEHREQIKNDQIQLTPRRVLGALDGVSIIGCAASTWHTVVHTGVSVFTFGKDAGQLGYRTDSGRQMSPRCVPLHLPSGSKIVQVAATERATAVLFSNGDLCILASYQQQKIILPDDRLPTKMSAYVPASELHVSIVKLTSDTELHLGMISSWGDTYLLPTTFPTSGNEAGRDNGSVGRFSRYVRRVWTSNTRRMDAVDFAIGHDASVLVCTRGGQVFCGKKRRSHSAASSGTSSGSGHAGSGKNNHYTFERVPGIHQAIMVRAGVSGSMAAVRLEVLPPIFPKTTPRLATDIAGAIVGQEHEDQDRQTLTKKLVQELCKDAPGLMPGDGLGDIAIHVGSTRFFGHSAILSARSQFFKRMLYEQKPFVKRRNMITLSFEPKSNDTSMANVRFSGCGPREVASVLIYIYIDDCPLSELDTDIMIELAGMLNLPGLTAKAQLSTKSQHLHTLNNAMLNMFTSACNISQEAGRLIRSRECTQQHRSDCGFVDVVLNLADCCVFAHRVVLIHRSPFFKAMLCHESFWLDKEKFPEVNLQHISWDVMSIVLRHIYTDDTITLMEDLEFESSDEFISFMETLLSVATELLLPRLKEACEFVLREQVHMRTALRLLSVADMFDAKQLEAACHDYLYRNLDAVLESSMLNNVEYALIRGFEQDIRRRIAQQRRVSWPWRHLRYDASCWQTRMSSEQRTNNVSTAVNALTGQGHANKQKAQKSPTKPHVQKQNKPSKAMTTTKTPKSQEKKSDSVPAKQMNASSSSTVIETGKHSVTTIKLTWADSATRSSASGSGPSLRDIMQQQECAARKKQASKAPLTPAATKHAVPHPITTTRSAPMPITQQAVQKQSKTPESRQILSTSLPGSITDTPINIKSRMSQREKKRQKGASTVQQNNPASKPPNAAAAVRWGLPTTSQSAPVKVIATQPGPSSSKSIARDSESVRVSVPNQPHRRTSNAQSTVTHGSRWAIPLPGVAPAPNALYSGAATGTNTSLSDDAFPEIGKSCTGNLRPAKPKTEFIRIQREQDEERRRMAEARQQKRSLIDIQTEELVLKAWREYYAELGFKNWEPPPDFKI